MHSEHSKLAKLWQRGLCFAPCLFARTKIVTCVDEIMATNPEEDLIARAKAVAEGLEKPWDERLERLLRFSARNPAAFPTPRGKKLIASASEVEDSYLKKYMGRYYRERARAIVLKDVKTK